MNRAIGKLELGAFAFLGIATIFSVLAALKTETYYLALIPLGILVVYTAIINFKFLYYLLLVSIPLSIEYYFSGSLATDLPDEPLMIGLMFITLIFVITQYKSVPTGFFGNFFIVALLTHLFWIFLCLFNSVEWVVSLKVFLAKLWYIITFCFLSAIIIRTKEDFKKAFWCVFIPLSLLVIQVLIRHAMLGFAFDEMNTPMFPFFRNHVNYAAILSIFFPFILWARTEYPTGSKIRQMLNASVLLYIAAIYFSYTRTCYLALLLIAPMYYIVRWRLTKVALAAVVVGATILIVHLFSENRYLIYAPNFEETTTHDKLDEHLSSTFEGKDVSSMERIYRWIAASYMWQDHPYMGFGPGNFYPNYQRYTVNSFRTYISDNEERSTAHNYFLLLLAEQGAIGLGVFLFLTGVIFIYGEKVYHRIKDPEDKKLAMTLLLVFTMVYVNLTLSDMLEADKAGPFFFMALGLIATVDIRNRASLEAKRE